MSVFSNNLLLGAGGQSTGPAPFDPTLIGNSVWFDGSADLYRTKHFHRLCTIQNCLCTLVTTK